MVGFMVKIAQSFGTTLELLARLFDKLCCHSTFLLFFFAIFKMKNSITASLLIFSLFHPLSICLRHLVKYCAMEVPLSIWLGAIWLQVQPGASLLSRKKYWEIKKSKMPTSFRRFRQNETFASFFLLTYVQHGSFITKAPLFVPESERSCTAYTEEGLYAEKGQKPQI